MRLALILKRTLFSSTIAIVFLLLGCRTKKEAMAKWKADNLITMIGVGDPVKEFPVKYFPLEKTIAVLTDLKGKCDFKNRKGKFVNHVYKKKINDVDQITFIYDYELKCDTVRFALTYKLNENIDLYEFSIQPLNLPYSSSK